jgi:hypothetical protein
VERGDSVDAGGRVEIHEVIILRGGGVRVKFPSKEGNLG